MNRIALFALCIGLAAITVFSQVKIKEASGSWESVYVKWDPVSGAQRYNVYYTGGGATDKKIEDQLIRSYGTYMRADILGLSAGSYTVKIVPVIGGSENTAAAAVTQSLSAMAQVREGYGFSGTSGRVMPGGYNENGTAKTGAKIIYISASNVNTVTCDVTNDKGTAVSTSGLMNILTARGKGTDKTPLIIRMIGCIKGSQITGLKDGNYIAFIGTNNTDKAISNITFEGVGSDATAHGYGFCLKRSSSIEIRNVGIMLFGDDGVSLDTDNGNIWIHNNDFFYGAPGADADQVKGDGTIDMKYNSSNITISYNHYWDSGKSMGCGGSTETVPTIYLTFHHNWFDHADSRNPRLHYTTAHVYNNYFDGISKYCAGNTTKSSAFVEANYFRHCNRPMLISGQGSDTFDPATGNQTAEGMFSGQEGGMTKAFNNKIENAGRLIYQTENSTHFDAYLVNSREEKIPASVKSLKGEFAYTNFDTDPTMYTSRPDSPEDVKSLVTSYAGRVGGGDFKWQFNDSLEDINYEIIAPLKAAITGYTTQLVSIQGEGGTGVNTPSVFPPSASVNLFLNSATNQLSIFSDATVRSIKIYTLEGILVHTAKADSKIIDMRKMTSGTYITVLKTEKGTFQKLIVKR